MTILEVVLSEERLMSEQDPFDFKSLVRTVKKVVNPEIEMPEDAEDQPIQYRIARLSELIKGLQDYHQETNHILGKVQTNLVELSELMQEKPIKTSHQKETTQKASKTVQDKADKGGDEAVPDQAKREGKSVKMNGRPSQASKQKTAEVAAVESNEKSEETNVVETEKSDDEAQSADHETEGK
mgnify:CR=1 FL=1